MKQYIGTSVNDLKCTTNMNYISLHAYYVFSVVFNHYSDGPFQRYTSHFEFYCF